VTMHLIVAKNPNAMAAGAVNTFTFTIDGNNLTLVQLRNQKGPTANPATIKLTRAE
jgi:hypothetical protein